MIRLRNIPLLLSFFVCVTLSADTSDFVLSTNKGEEKLHFIGTVAREFAVEFEVTPANSDSKFGIVLKEADDSAQWIYIGCDLTSDILCYSHWFLNTPSVTKPIAKDIAKFYKGYKRHVRMVCLQNSISIYVDGEKVVTSALPYPLQDGQRLSFRGHNGASVSVTGISLHNLNPPAPRPTEEGILKLSNNRLEVRFDGRYPVPVSYKLYPSGNDIQGAAQTTGTVLINGRPYPLNATASQSGGEVIYNSSVDELGVRFVARFSVEDQVLNMAITDITEPSGFRIQTLAFPNHDLVSVANTVPGGMLSIAHDVRRDEFIALDTIACQPVPKDAAIAILNTNDYAVTIDNNSIYNARQINYRVADGRTSLYSNEWIYRGPDGKVLPLPRMKVIFAEDRNGDHVIDWQDGAAALADVYPEPYAADRVRNSYATITMNFASGAQYPFTRQLDNIKRFYLATDGFGQMLELKGYQSEGHDSGHPDYAGNYNRRAGGLDALRHLTEQARHYNAHVGLHINQSEAYPEAKAYSDELVTDIKGWAWLDQAYLINKERDVLDGSFGQRLSALNKDLPELSFIYIDTYREHRYLAYNTAKLFNENGWAIWTEDQEVFFREGVWTHDPSNAQSMIARFVQHTFRDGYREHPLLLGGYSRGAEVGFMGWQKGRDFNRVTENFFTRQLPYRYLMHFKMQRITPDEAQFESGVASRIVDGKHTIARNGMELKRGNKLFIPWNPLTEEKIYHYNLDGGVSSWTLPDSWKNLTQVKLYTIDHSGRHFVADIPVDGQQIIIDARPRQGYIIYPSEPAALPSMNWGEGSLAANPGFDGGLAHWKCTGNTQVEETSYGQSFLKIAGKGSATQQLNLEKNRSYVVSVWCEVTGKGNATLSIDNKSYTITESPVKNFTDNTDKYNTRYQRIKIPYIARSGNPKLKLAFKAGNDTSFVAFDDVRVVESTHNPCREKGSYYEDFESVDEGWGPFIASKPSAYTTHLSERHEGFTNDVIDGNWSLKTWNEGDGEVYRTSPSLLNLLPGKKYRIAFDYRTTQPDVYRVIVRSTKTGEELLNAPLNEEGVFGDTFTTGRADDYYVAIVKKGNGTLIMDNFRMELY